MAEPRTATTKKGQRFYTWRGDQYWSVTTIIGGGVPKPALLPWGIKMVAEGAVRIADSLPALVREDADAAVRMLKGMPYANRDRAADLGTSVHEAVEAYVLDKPMPKWKPPVAARMLAFEKYLADCSPVYEATEASVFNRTQRYAGTLDAIVHLDGHRRIIDVKTGKGVYPEAALQLAAYRYAEFIGGADGDEVPMPTVDGALVLHLPDEGGRYELFDVRADEAVFSAFLYCREVFRWQEETSKGVIQPYARFPLEVAS